MTEREKMLAGELYDCGDPELLERWHMAKNLVRDYNYTDSEDMVKKEMLESKLSEEIKRNTHLGRRIRQLEKELEEEKNKSFFIKIKQSIINVIK